MWKYMVVICSHLSSLFNILLYHSFFGHSHDHCFGFPSEQTIEPSSLSTAHYKPEPSGTSDESPAECAVCLCKIEEGDEVRELRCAHLFHKQCLDRWTGFQHATCPLCRSFLAPPRSTLVSHSQQFVQSEVLLFKFCSFSSDSDDGDGWWLR